MTGHRAEAEAALTAVPVEPSNLAAAVVLQRGILHALLAIHDQGQRGPCESALARADEMDSDCWDAAERIADMKARAEKAEAQVQAVRDEVATWQDHLVIVAGHINDLLDGA